MFQPVRTIQNGIVLPRIAKVIPQAGVSPLYTISGKVLIAQIDGEVTTAVAGGANASKVQFKPTGQTAIDLCATADINGLLVGQLLSVIGPAATAMAIGWGVLGATGSWILGPGTLDLNCVAAAGTGAIKWTVRYFAYPGGFLAAA